MPRGACLDMFRSAVQSCQAEKPGAATSRPLCAAARHWHFSAQGAGTRVGFRLGAFRSEIPRTLATGFCALCARKRSHAENAEHAET